MAARECIKQCWSVFDWKACIQGVVAESQISLALVFKRASRLVRLRDCKLGRNHRKCERNGGGCSMSWKDVYMLSQPCSNVLTCGEGCKMARLFAVVTIPQSLQCYVHVWWSLASRHRQVTRCFLTGYKERTFPLRSLPLQVLYGFNARASNQFVTGGLPYAASTAYARYCWCTYSAAFHEIKCIAGRAGALSKNKIWAQKRTRHRRQVDKNGCSFLSTC